MKKKEEYWIDYFNSIDLGYNKSNNSFGLHIISKSTRLLLSKASSGEKSGMSKLNWIAVNNIRKNKENLSQRKLAKKFNVNRKFIKNIILDSKNLAP